VGALLIVSGVLGIAIVAFVLLRDQREPPDAGKKMALNSASSPAAEAGANSTDKAAPTVATASPTLKAHPAGQAAFNSTARTPDEPITTTDSISLPEILEALESSEEDVRAEAIEDLRQLGDRSAIPQLREIQQRTTDPEAKAELLETIRFLEMPTMAEASAARHAYRIAHGLPPEAHRSSTIRGARKTFGRWKLPTSTNTP